MSSLPGVTLEDYVAWQYDLKVCGHREANLNRAFAEAIGACAERPWTTESKFKQIVAVVEGHRESIEDWLLDFDEEKHSWRGYAGGVEWFSKEEEEKIMSIIKDTSEEDKRFIIVKNAENWDSYWDADPKLTPQHISHSAHMSHTGNSIDAVGVIQGRLDAEMWLAQYNEANPSGYYGICELLEES